MCIHHTSEHETFPCRRNIIACINAQAMITRAECTRLHGHRRTQPAVRNSSVCGDLKQQFPSTNAKRIRQPKRTSPGNVHLRRLGDNMPGASTGCRTARCARWCHGQFPDASRWKQPEGVSERQIRNRACAFAQALRHRAATLIYTTVLLILDSVMHPPPGCTR